MTKNCHPPVNGFSDSDTWMSAARTPASSNNDRAGDREKRNDEPKPPNDDHGG